MTHSSWYSSPVYGNCIFPRHVCELSVNGHGFDLHPLTVSDQASIHIDLKVAEIDQDTARALINSLLSHFSWFSGQPAWLGNGVIGLPTKTTTYPRRQGAQFTDFGDAFPKAITLTNDWVTQRALAFYRNAQNAREYSHADACLSFYKIIEIEKIELINKHGRKKGIEKLNQWIDQKLEELHRISGRSVERLTRMASKKGVELNKFIYEGIRNEAAHFLKDSNVNLDDPRTSIVFEHALYPMQFLAEEYIEHVLNFDKNIIAHCMPKQAGA
jgi:hypothetical protein